MSRFQNNEYNINRYPNTESRSLKAWNASDEHILQYVDSLDVKKAALAICNDRFGFLTCNLHNLSPNVFLNYASQKKAILQNLETNQLSKESLSLIEPLTDLTNRVNLAIIKIPKSMDLFRLQLFQISKSLAENGIVLCGFMTKYFTRQMLEIASEFFENVEQSLAWKKSRVLKLQSVKPQIEHNIINSISFENQIFKQYFGVFSARNIDYASQFFIKNWKVKNDLRRVLDLASGNGFLAKMIRSQNADCEIHLVDDDWLAVESSKFNFDDNNENTFFHFNDSLEHFEDGIFDLIVCNPPFHFEFETNIEVAIQLFKQVKRCLTRHGSFQLVSNRHLNYKSHLVKMFGKVELLNRNKKFEIYKCSLYLSN